MNTLGLIGVSAFPQNTDPIIKAVDDFRSAFEDFGENAPEDEFGSRAYAEATYRGPRRVLLAWSEPIRTLSGASSAVKLAREAHQNGDDDLAGVLLGCVADFFEANEP